jgi:hypothetical protein
MLPAPFGRSSMIHKNGNYFRGKIMRRNNGLSACGSLHLNPFGSRTNTQRPTPRKDDEAKLEPDRPDHALAAIKAPKGCALDFKPPNGF